MKVKVKLDIEYGHLSHKPIVLKAVYKTNKSLCKKEVEIIRYNEIYHVEAQDPFIVQLERFLSNGNVKERVCEIVRSDIIKNMTEKHRKKLEKKKLEKLLIKALNIKFTFDIDEDNI